LEVHYKIFTFDLGLDQLARGIGSDLSKGLTQIDEPTLDKRRLHFGTNRKDPPEKTPYWKFFLKAIDDFMLKLLLVCACIDIGFEVGFSDEADRSHGKLHEFVTDNIAWIEGFAIFLAVFIVAFVGSYNDYKKEE